MRMPCPSSPKRNPRRPRVHACICATSLRVGGDPLPNAQTDRAAAAKRTSNVAGGHIIRSTAASLRAPSTIRLNSAVEDRRPFIFQLPATSGRRGTRTIFVSRGFPNPARRLAECPRARQRAAGDGLPVSPYVATQSPPPYDAMALGPPRVLSIPDDPSFNLS